MVNVKNIKIQAYGSVWVWVVYILVLAVTKQKFSIDLEFIAVNQKIKLIKHVQNWIWGAISASCVSILVIFTKVLNGTMYMGNFLPPKLPDDCQCWTPLCSISHMESGREAWNTFFDRKSLSRMLRCFALISSSPMTLNLPSVPQKILQLCYRMNDKGQRRELTIIDIAWYKHMLRYTC